MTLYERSRLGPYEILAPIGAGGQVYRGKDTRLEGTVTMKVLPASFSRETSREAPPSSVTA